MHVSDEHPTGISARISTAVLMADTRAPDIGIMSHKFSLKNLTAHSLTYYLNMKHACLHTYQLLFFRLVEEGCQHLVCGGAGTRRTARSLPLARLSPGVTGGSSFWTAMHSFATQA